MRLLTFFANGQYKLDYAWFISRENADLIILAATDLFQLKTLDSLLNCKSILSAAPKEREAPCSSSPHGEGAPSGVGLVGGRAGRAFGAAADERFERLTVG